MAITIDNARIQTFENNVIHLAQQATAKLRDKVMVRGPHSEKHNWDRLGTTEATEKTAGRTATPEADSPWTRRTGVNKVWHNGDTVEKEDVLQMIIEPRSALQQSLAMSMNRKLDDIIIDAADGTTNTLDGDGNTVTVPTTQVLGSTANVISFDLITEVQEAFMANEIDPSEPKCFVVGPTQVRKLMQLTEQTSDSYVSRKLDQLSSTGIVPNWMGFDWIMSNRLNVPATSALNCLAFTRKAIGLHISEDISTEIGKDPSKSFMWRVYCRMMAYAIRVEDEQIFTVQVKDAMS